MIEINLLPEDLRKKESTLKKIDIASVVLSNLSFAKFAVIVCAVLLVIHSSLFVLGLAGKAKLSSLTKEDNILGDDEKKALALKLSADIMNRKKTAIDELMVKRFEWAKKLNDLSDSMTAGIWLSNLSYDEKSVEITGNGARPAGDSGKPKADGKRAMKCMVISGYASSRGEEGTASIGKFIKSLKDDAGFYGDFSGIELGSIKRDKIEGQDVMNFKITCLFKEAE